jgi:hypothetical protein
MMAVPASNDRPRLSPEREEALAPIDQASAQCYDSMEDTARRFKDLAGLIDSSDDDGTVAAEILGDTSVVRHITELRSKVSSVCDGK